MARASAQGRCTHHFLGQQTMWSAGGAFVCSRDAARLRTTRGHRLGRRLRRRLLPQEKDPLRQPTPIFWNLCHKGRPVWGPRPHPWVVALTLV